MTKPPVAGTYKKGVASTRFDVKIDFLSLTYQGPMGWQWVAKQLGISPGKFEMLQLFQDGYRTQYVIHHITIRTDPLKEEWGIHVDISGQGARYLEQQANFSWTKLLNNLNHRGFKATRLDLAMDDYDEKLKIKTIRNKLLREEVTTRSQVSVYNEGSDHHRQAINGRSVYIGSAKSLKSILFYDKSVEQKAKGHRVLGDKWNRYELRLKKAYAQQAFETIAKSEADLGRYMVGILASSVTFRVRPKGGDTNKARWRVSPWWQRFLGDVERINLSSKAHNAEVQPLEKRLRWMIEAVSPNFYVLAKYLGVEGITQVLLTQGEKRLSARHRVQLQHMEDDSEGLAEVLQSFEKLKA